MLALLAAGCGVQAPDDGESVAQLVQRLEREPSAAAKVFPPLEFASRVPGEWFDLGQLNVSVVADADVGTATVVEDDPAMKRRASESADEGTTLVVASRDLERAFLLKPDHASLRAMVAQRGEVSRRPGDARPTELEWALEDQQSLGLSNGIDNRTLRSVAISGLNHSTYKAIGMLVSNGSCTATFLGNQNVIITAAHCIMTANGDIVWGLFMPRKDGGTQPFGVFRMTVAGWDSKWVSNGCYAGIPDIPLSCITHDIALVVLEPLAGAVQPGWLGYGSFTSGTLNGNSKYTRGYPACGNADSPNPCSPFTLYGDPGFSLGSYGALKDGKYRRAKGSYDSSPGQSGSALYVSYDEAPHVFGVHSATECGGMGTTCSLGKPSWGRLIDGEWFDIIDTSVW